MWVRWSFIHRSALSRRSGARRTLLAALAALLGTAATSALADPPVQSGREVWAGADISQNVWLLYSGVTVAPWSGIHDPGFRFRAAGGYGGYTYSDRVAGTEGPSLRPVAFRAQTYYGDVLVGYLARYGELTAKAFVGASILSHDISPTDEETVAIGEEIGVKGVVELWLNVGERGWASLDLSWSSAHDTRTARTRIGYRVWPKLSVGLEAGLNLDSQGDCRMQPAGTSGCRYADDTSADPADLLDYARGGLFARYEWGVSEASVSVGVLGDSFDQGSDIEVAPYVTVNWLTQF